MTACSVERMEKPKEKKKRFTDIFCRGAMSGIFSVLCLSLLLFLLIFYSREAGEFALSGMRLAVVTVIPTAFVSMLICDIYRVFGCPERIPVLGRIFSRIFGVSPYCLRAFVLGNLCGFPMGARELGAAYHDGLINRDEAERMIPVCSNPSPTFVIGVVGGMIGDIHVGITLFVCVFLSSCICGVMGRKNRCYIDIPRIVLRQKYNLVESIRASGFSLISIFSFISAFAIPLGFVDKYLDFFPLKCVIFLVTEVTGAVNFFVTMWEYSPLFSGVGCAFALGFGGVSVMLQSVAFARDYGLSQRGYIYTKTLQGLICAVMYFCAFRFLL